MCKVYNTVGSLTVIKQRLRVNKIDCFHSTNQLLDFQRNYDSSRHEIILNHRAQVAAERDNLNSSILLLESEVENDKVTLQQKLQAEVGKLRQEIDEIAEAEKTFVQEFTFSFKALSKLLKIYYIQIASASTITRSIKPKIEHLAEQRKRLQYLTDYFESAVDEKSSADLRDLDHKKKVIDEISSFIYGAIGEQKVVDELNQLPDEYVLINDFYYYFPRAIAYPSEKSWIRTIQIDHLLISRAGIFIIETKNWSKKSVESLDLRSPVQQIRRTNYALHKLLSGNIKVNHHWGEKKIQLRNLIVLINNKPMGEFEYVKVLTLNKVVHHIRRFKPSLSHHEAQGIADWLIQIRN